MYSWEDLRKEILRQEIEELREQKVPKDDPGYIQHRVRIMNPRRELASLLAKDNQLATNSLNGLAGKLYEKPKDVSKEEILRVVDLVENKVEMMEYLIAKRNSRLQEDMQRAWQRASLSQRGRIATIYSMHTFRRCSKRIPYHMLRFCLNRMRLFARKRG